METNIASRQTKNWFAGARGFRPTLNSYLYADALAIASIAERKGNEELAAEYRAKAADLKTQVEKNLWDSKREFFFQMYRDTETHNGHTLEAGSLTHQTGQFAGSPHGRELIGFVPWQFNLPGPGYEAAWKYLMDPDYFHAEFGPTVTERNDPMFRISPNCCVWSGNSWPFATGQTLKAMANALRNYENLPITANHYYKLLSIYSNTHRKGGRPYIAEACHPDTGSWDGHDRFNHSEHYFHSTFADLIVTGLIGLEPGPGSEVKLRPLAPSEWDYFCLDGVMCKGHDLAILWDRDGSRYGRGAGLLVLSGGNKIAERPDLGELKFLLNPDLKRTRRQQPELYNVAVNNTGKAWPRAIASSFDHLYPPHKLLDGQAWYMESPPNRWQPHHDDESPWVGVDFGTERTVSELRVFPLDSINDIIPDSAGSRNSDRRIQVPSAMTVEVWQDNKWESAEVTAKPSIPRGRQANRHKFGSPIRTRKVRVLMTPQNDSGVAMSEIEAWGAASLPLTEPPPPSDNLAASATVTTSSENRPDPGTKAIDGIVNYDLNGGPNRWATKRRPKETPTDQLGSDWLELDFGDRKSFNEVRLHFCRSRHGMGAPARYELKVKDGDRWTPIPSQDKSPSQPISETINVIKFPVIARRYLRLEVSHGDRKPVCALSEIEIFSRAAKKPQQFRSGD